MIGTLVVTLLVLTFAAGYLVGSLERVLNEREQTSLRPRESGARARAGNDGEAFTTARSTLPLIEDNVVPLSRWSQRA